MVVTFLLGFVAAWHHDFETKDEERAPNRIQHGSVSSTSQNAIDHDPGILVYAHSKCISLAAVAGPARNSGCARAINALARSLDDFPLRFVQPNSVTTM